MGSSRPDAAAILAACSREVDGALWQLVDGLPLDGFYDLMRYHLGWAGDGAAAANNRRLRSGLCLLACEACGGARDRAMPMAMAVAILHNFARLQEDVEQGREMSRGRPAIWSRWGLPQALNVGDGMHALAKEALLTGADRLPAATILRLSEELDQCTLRLCETIERGLRQPAEPDLTGDNAGIRSLVDGNPNGNRAEPDLAVEKAGILYGCAAFGGAYLAGASDRRQRQLRRFGQLLGSALASPERSPALLAELLQALNATGLAAEELRAVATYLTCPANGDPQ